MSLSYLDDPDPPDFDASRWRQVGARSRSIARRRRFRSGVGSAVVVVAIGLAAIWSVHPDGRSVVRVAISSTTSSTTSSSSPTSTTVLDPSDWVTVELEVDQTVVTAGQDVTGTMVFHNRRATPVRLSFGGCAAKWTVVVGAGTKNPGAAFGSDCQFPAAEKPLAPGVTRIPFRAPATYQACGGDASSAPGLPTCIGGHLPPLPAGRATLWFVTDGTIPHLVVPAAPIAVDIEQAAPPG